MSSITWRRAGAVTGLIAVVLAFVGDAIATGGNSTDVHSSDAAILAALNKDHGAAWHVGVGMALLGFAGLMVFAAYLASELRNEGWLANATLGSGVMFAALKLVSVIPVWEATWRAPHLDAATARTLMDFGDFAFEVCLLPAALLVGFAALGSLRTGLLPRGLAIAGVAIAVLGIVTMPIGVDGPSVLPWLLGLLWIAAASVVLARGAGARAGALAIPLAADG
jgi:hypothetical protein